MRNRSALGLLLILSPFVFSFAFGLDIYVPIIPKIGHIFDTTQAMVQMTLSLFLLANGVGELLIGPVSDQIGRFKTIVISAMLYSLGGALSAMSATIGVLIVARIICALGASGLLVVAFAIIRDLYSGNQSAKMMSFLNAAIGISPTFAPIIGGYLDHAFGWESVFWFLAALGGVTLVVCLIFVKETHPVEKRVRITLGVFKRYKQLFSNKIFLKYAIFAGLGVSICFSFFSVSSLILIKLLHIKEIHFGYYFALFGLVIGIGGIISGHVAARWGVDKTIRLGVIILLIGGLSMFLTQYTLGLTLWGFMISTMIACTGAIFLIGSGAAGAMEPYPQMAGLAAAGLGFLQFFISSAIGSLLMLFPVASSLSFSIAIIVVGILAIINTVVLR